MQVCTFFGHRECPDNIRPLLCCHIEELIINNGVTMFYVGNQGRFDTLVRSVLRELVGKYPFVGYAVVLAYMPKEGLNPEDYTDTMLPEGIEKVPPRYAIAWRNDWMISRSDYVLAYITHSWGGAAKYVEKAKKQGKIVLSIL